MAEPPNCSSCGHVYAVHGIGCSITVNGARCRCAGYVVYDTHVGRVTFAHQHNYMTGELVPDPQEEVS